MAESMHKSSDVPNFDTYPATPADELTDYKGVAGPSVERYSTERSSLEKRAVELGAAAGKIALIMRQSKENLEQMAQHNIYGRLSGLAENARIRSGNLRRLAGARVQEFAHAAQEKAAVLGEQARERTQELGRHARSNYFRARRKAKQTVHEYPVETALAAGAVGVLIGVALRIGRARRAN